MTTLGVVGAGPTGSGIAEACLFLSGVQSSFVSSATLTVTGGHFRRQAGFGEERL